MLKIIVRDILKFRIFGYFRGHIYILKFEGRVYITPLPPLVASLNLGVE